MPVQDNVHARRRHLSQLIEDGAVDSRVTDIIMPKGEPLPDEDTFWDYKITLPCAEEYPDKSELAAKMAEIVKDVVAFHNVEGGYIISGVRDTDKVVDGCSSSFDINDLCKKIQGATRASIDAKFRSFDLETPYGRRTIGLIYIPRRPETADPVQFLKDAPVGATGKRAYQANEIYMRSREECRSARTAEDYSTLFRRGTRALPSGGSSQFLENNIPAKDPSLIEFVGRGDHLDELWRWFTDRYTAVKLLSGPGGVGKTSIAWSFCDAVSQSPPTGIDKIVWLTAKKRTYAATLGGYIDIGHTHFEDLNSLLVAVLEELGTPRSSLPDDVLRQELIDAVLEAVKISPCLLVVDDIDSLPQETQFDVFRTVSTIFDRAIAGGVHRARALLTARLGLGAAPGQLMIVDGMPLEEFEEYVAATAASIRAPLPKGPNWKNDLRRLHEASSGSPLFAASILRLMSLGESLSSAIRQHKGSEGEEVRRFAFEREVDALTDYQMRLLYAAIVFKAASPQELVSAIDSNRTAVRDGIASLRDYHLVNIATDTAEFAQAEGRVKVPSVIVDMADIVRKKIGDPKRIETNCGRVRRETGDPRIVIARLIAQITYYWKDDDYPLALEAALDATKKHPGAADLWCMLGRAHLKLKDPAYSKADVALRKAAELGCTRPELIPLRIEAKEGLSDWSGIVSLLSRIEPASNQAQYTLSLARAYQQIGDDQRASNTMSSAASSYLRGAEIIQDAFNEHRAYGLVDLLREQKFDLASSYFESISSQSRRSDEKLDIWAAAVRVTRLGVANRSILSGGLLALDEWWRATARRVNVDERTAGLQRRSLEQISSIARELDKRGGNWPAYALQMKAKVLELRKSMITG